MQEACHRGVGMARAEQPEVPDGRDWDPCSADAVTRALHAGVGMHHGMHAVRGTPGLTSQIHVPPWGLKARLPHRLASACTTT